MYPEQRGEGDDAEREPVGTAEDPGAGADAGGVQGHGRPTPRKGRGGGQGGATGTLPPYTVRYIIVDYQDYHCIS